MWCSSSPLAVQPQASNREFRSVMKPSDSKSTDVPVVMVLSFRKTCGLTRRGFIILVVRHVSIVDVLLHSASPGRAVCSEPRCNAQMQWKKHQWQRKCLTAGAVCAVAAWPLHVVHITYCSKGFCSNLILRTSTGNIKENHH